MGSSAAGKIAGAALGCVALLSLIVFIIWWFVTHRNQKVTTARRGTTVDLTTTHEGKPTSPNPSHSPFQLRFASPLFSSKRHTPKSNPGKQTNAFTPPHVQPPPNSFLHPEEDLERADALGNLRPNRSRSTNNRHQRQSSRSSHATSPPPTSSSSGWTGPSDPRPQGQRYPYLTPAPAHQRGHSIDTFTASNTVPPTTATEAGTGTGTDGNYTEPWLGSDMDPDIDLDGDGIDSDAAPPSSREPSSVSPSIPSRPQLAARHPIDTGRMPNGAHSSNHQPFHRLSFPLSSPTQQGYTDYLESLQQQAYNPQPTYIPPAPSSRPLPPIPPRNFAPVARPPPADLPLSDPQHRLSLPLQLSLLFSPLNPGAPPAPPAPQLPHSQLSSPGPVQFPSQQPLAIIQPLPPPTIPTTRNLSSSSTTTYRRPLPVPRPSSTSIVTPTSTVTPASTVTPTSTVSAHTTKPWVDDRQFGQNPSGPGSAGYKRPLPTWPVVNSGKG